MTVLIPKGTLVVSCQARADNPLHGPVYMAAMALAAEAGKPMPMPGALKDGLGNAGRLHSENRRAQDRAKRVEQEHQRMKAGYDEVFKVS